MNPYFEPERVAVLEPTLREIAHRFLQPLLDRGHGDLADDWARHLPVRAVCAFLRVPEDDADWIQSRIRCTWLPSRTIEKRPAGLSGELDEYARRLVAKRRAEPLDARLDIVSGLLQQGVAGRDADDDVVAGFVRVGWLLLPIAAPRTGSVSRRCTWRATLRCRTFCAPTSSVCRTPLRSSYDSTPRAMQQRAPPRVTWRFAVVRSGKVRSSRWCGWRPTAIHTCLPIRTRSLSIADPIGTLHSDTASTSARVKHWRAYNCGSPSRCCWSARVSSRWTGRVPFQTWPEYGPRQLPARLIRS